MGVSDDEPEAFIDCDARRGYFAMTATHRLVPIRVFQARMRRIRQKAESVSLSDEFFALAPRLT